MPKRIATPPPGDHEPKFLAVHYPYPYMANMEVVQDRINLARWVGCIIPKDHLWSIHHKPSAPNTVILEISSDFTDWELILGEHKASAFLRNPGDDANRVSRVYFSTLSNTREVEKAGWKRIDIVEEWFIGFDRNNRRIAFPYPKPNYCPLPLPAEDRTNRGLWRPLPKKYFPERNLSEPKPAPVPTVGSSDWVGHKDIEAKPKDAATSVAPAPISSDVSLSSSNSDPTTPQEVNSSGQAEAKNVWEQVPRWGTLGKDSAVIPQDGLCPVHGTRCRKGICAFVGKAKRAKEGPPPASQAKQGGNRRPGQTPPGSQPRSPQRASFPGSSQRASFPGSSQRSSHPKSPNGNTSSDNSRANGPQGGDDNGGTSSTIPKDKNNRGPQTTRSSQNTGQTRDSWRKS